jgi:hypothetical protein
MTILNPIKRIYVDANGSVSKKIYIELELPREFEICWKNTRKLILETPSISNENEINNLFDTICTMFGITIQKSNLAPVTFVNMFCSDKDAKLSDTPQPIPKQQGVLL